MPVGVRLDPKHDERTRAKIRTSQLLNRLEMFALGLPDPAARNGKPVDMTPSQVEAAKTLLRKTLPDLSSTTLQGNPDQPLRAEVVYRWDGKSDSNP